jgi:hypothetical protein
MELVLLPPSNVCNFEKREMHAKFITGGVYRVQYKYMIVVH